MHHSFAAIALALSASVLSGVHAAQTAAPAAESVTFGAEHLTAGTKVKLHHSSTMSMDMGGMAMKAVDEQILQGEVMLDGKVRIHVEKDAETNENAMAGNKTQESPFHGKTVIATWKDDQLALVAEDGGALEEGEPLLQLHALVSAVMLEDPLGHLLRRNPVAVGVPLDVPKDIAQSLLGLAEEQAEWVKKYQLTLTGTEERDGTTCGVFAVSVGMDMVMDPSMPAIKTIMTGTLHVCTKTGRRVAESMSGPLNMDLAEFGITISGEVGFAGRTELSR